MWISSVHIVVVYICACALAAEIRSKFERTNKKSMVKRSVGAYSNSYNINTYNSNKYNTYNSLSTVKLRHHSRFPNLDKVMTRVNNMKLGSNDKSVNSGVHNKLRHDSWYGKRITTTTTSKTTENFENYFDDDYEDDKEDDSSWEYDDDNEYVDYEEDGVFSDSSEWQAEEPTEKPTTAAPVNRQMSKISAMKWQMYGTREKVEENRKKELFGSSSRSETSATLARDHFRRINSEGTCKKPSPRVISVQSEHPDASRSYTPHCTVLHRCAEDTGCCHHHTLRCGPKTQEEVHLYFYTRTLGTLQSQIEKLTFWNHTECTCVERAKSGDKNFKIEFKSGFETRTTTPQNLENCSCPGSFSPKKKYESQCTCNCEETNPECLRKKDGMEFFSLADRKCVLEKRCGIPICEFGAYLRLKGRCPKKQEKLDAFEHLNIYNKQR